MIRIISLCCLLFIFNTSAANDLLISNARIVDGNGTVIPQGFIVIEDGKITQVSAGDASVKKDTTIDAQGMTVMPGLIDGHRHIIGAPIDSDVAMKRWLDEDAPDEMLAFLDAGFTTILSAGDDTKTILELRRRLHSGELLGPRLQVAGQRIRTPEQPGEWEKCMADTYCKDNNSLVRNEAEARAKVREFIEDGVDTIKVRYDSNNPNGLTRSMFAAIVKEADQYNIPVIAHSTEVQDMITSIEVGTSRLVHTPHTGTLDGTDGARLVKEAGVPVTSTLGVWVPLFREDNLPRFRNGSPFPRPGIARGGQGPVNARYLWDEGVTIAFGTDTRFSPVDSLIHELRPLRVMFSPRDIVDMLTKNAAIFMEMEAEVGTLEAGKLADIVMLDGDPLKDSNDLLKVKLVIKDGKVVVDKR